MITVANQIHPWIPFCGCHTAFADLTAGTVWPAFWGGAGMFALGWLGLSRAYRATVRFYRAEERGKPPPQLGTKPKPIKSGRNWV